LFLIDNYVAFIESYDQYEDALALLSREAASYGIYLVLSMNNSGEIRSRIRQNFTLGIALQMPDKYEYEAVVGDRTEIVPMSRTPGRGLIKAPLPIEFQTAMCIREETGMSLAQTLRRHFAAVTPSPGESVKKLGDTLDGLSFDALMSREDVTALPENEFALGLAIEDGKLVTIALDEEFCFTVGGSSQSGKTNLLAVIAKQAKAKGAQVILFDDIGGVLETLDVFDIVVHSDAELFELMENTMVSEFSLRNGAVNDARDENRNVQAAMKDYRRIVFLINDMSLFMQAAYSPNMDMSDFLVVALEKGREHKIQFFAAVTPDENVDMARFAAMRTWARWGRGVHLGGMFDQQSILRFEMSAADSVRQLSAGAGYADDGNGNTVKIITPQI
jgi:S-DNA-T family DNA segregation ATPase FtsK/SpoIIIE